METAARGTTTSSTSGCAEISMAPVYRFGGVAPSMVPDGWGGCDAWATGMQRITDESRTEGHGPPLSADCVLCALDRTFCGLPGLACGRVDRHRGAPLPRGP